MRKRQGSRDWLMIWRWYALIGHSAINLHCSQFEMETKGQWWSWEKCYILTQFLQCHTLFSNLKPCLKWWTTKTVFLKKKIVSIHAPVQILANVIQKDRNIYSVLSPCIRPCWIARVFFPLPCALAKPHATIIVVLILCCMLASIHCHSLQRQLSNLSNVNDR